MPKRMRFFIGILLLVTFGCCTLSLGLVNLHICSAFKVRTRGAQVTAGQSASFTFWQSDPLGGALGHACWGGMPLYVEGLPPGSKVSSVEWSYCHIGTMTISTQPITPPGKYRLKISKNDGLFLCPSPRLTLEVRAP
jgi:hypothetical protein